MFKTLFNPLQYVASCMWFPFAISNFNTQGLHYINFGYWDSTIQGYPCNTLGYAMAFTSQLVSHPQIARGAYLNYAPYTKATLYLPVFGAVPIDMTFRDAYRDYIYCALKIDVHTGMATMRCYFSNGTFATDGGKRCFAERTGQYGVPVALSQTLDTALSATVGGFGQMVNAIGQKVVDFLGFDGGDVFTTSGTPTVSSTGANGSLLVTLTPAFIEQEHILLTDEDLADYGRPLDQVKTINTLSGYVKCAEAHPALPITKAENDKITEYMLNGFFYE